MKILDLRPQGEKQSEGKTIITVEQSAKKGLEFADIGFSTDTGRKSPHLRASAFSQKAATE